MSRVQTHDLDTYSILETIPRDQKQDLALFQKQYVESKKHNLTPNCLSETVSTDQKHDLTPKCLPEAVSRAQKHDLDPVFLPETASRDQKHDSTPNFLPEMVSRV